MTDSVIPTLEQVRAKNTVSVGAMSADWSFVNPAGDLLYVGGCKDVRRRLVDRNGSHIMWSIYEHETKRSPLVRVAVWQMPRAEDAANVEVLLTDLCQPLWSRCSGKATAWYVWRDPDFLVKPPELTEHLDHVPGAYAWVYLPEGAALYTVMVDQASGRAGRRVPAHKQQRRRDWEMALPLCCGEAFQSALGRVAFQRKQLRSFECPVHGFKGVMP